jgi:predicted ATPase
VSEQFNIFGDEDSIRESYPTAFLPSDPKAPHLKRIEIKAFKGIREQVVEFPKIAVLTGPNNSGKSTILQAVVAGFECFRLCLDTDKWKLSEHGRAVKELNFLPVNAPKDLWYQAKTRKPKESGEAKRREQYVSLTLVFTNDFFFTVEIRFLYGFLNIRVTEVTKNTTEEILLKISSSAPILIPGISGLIAHEPLYTPVEIHRAAAVGQLSGIIRNILLELQKREDVVSMQSSAPGKKPELVRREEFAFVSGAIKRHFGLELQRFKVDPNRDLEIRAPYREQDYELDIVSAGSGLIQMLQLVSAIVWRKSRIILFDEPDSHLHTNLQARLYNFLKEISDKMNLQIILATHSKDLISQAPMECIIPVDPSKTKLVPIQSMDHLLLEYKRYGAIDNVDLALLYKSKRCLFVEGDSDIKYLPLLAEILKIGCFQGAEQVVMFKFKGADKFTMVYDLVKLFETMVGGTIKWMVLRDRDYATPSIVDKYKEQAKEKGIKNFHIWQMFEVENYILQPECLLASVSQKLVQKGKEPAKQAEIVQLLKESCDDLLTETQAQYITKTQDAYRRLELASNWKEDGVKDALEFCKSNLKDLPSMLVNIPGDRVFGKLVGRLQQKFGINIRAEEIISVMNPTFISTEIRSFLERLNSL